MLIILFSALALGFCLALLTLRRHFRLQRLTQSVVIPREIQMWQEIATSLFAGDDENLGRHERMQLILRSGLQRLGLSGGLITINDEDTCRVEARVTAKNTAPDHLRAGQEVSLALTYCGLLDGERESLAIEYASLCDWRLHSAHRDLGWETFIGTRRILASGKFLTVCFYDWTAREQLYSPEEKAFVGQLASWIATIHETNGFQSAAAYLDGHGAEDQRMETVLQ